MSPEVICKPPRLHWPSRSVNATLRAKDSSARTNFGAEKISMEQGSSSSSGPRASPAPKELHENITQQSGLNACPGIMSPKIANWSIWSPCTPTNCSKRCNPCTSSNPAGCSRLDHVLLAVWGRARLQGFYDPLRCPRHTLAIAPHLLLVRHVGYVASMPRAVANRGLVAPKKLRALD